MAVELAALEGVVISKLILVESFLLPPGPFFQNLLWAMPAEGEAQFIPEMLRREQGRYSPRLRATLLSQPASRRSACDGASAAADSRKLTLAGRRLNPAGVLE